MSNFCLENRFISLPENILIFWKFAWKKEISQECVWQNRNFSKFAWKNRNFHDPDPGPQISKNFFTSFIKLSLLAHLSKKHVYTKRLFQLKKNNSVLFINLACERVICLQWNFRTISFQRRALEPIPVSLFQVSSPLPFAEYYYVKTAVTSAPKFLTQDSIFAPCPHSLPTRSWLSLSRK